MPLEIPGTEISHLPIPTGDAELHCVVAGPADGPLVVLLHGFPEFWWSWRKQIPALVQAGYRVLVPDLRGYNLSSKPTAVNSFSLVHLAEDVRRLILSQGRAAAIIVGHDWGGGVAYEFAMHHGSMVEKLVILNVPHPVQMQRALRTWRQIKKSWYIFFFQIPWLPEYLLLRRGGSWLRAVFLAGIPEENIENYMEAALRPGSLAAAINYYRCSFRQMLMGKIRNPKVINRPTLVIWGENDAFLEKAFAIPPKNLVPNVEMAWLPQSSHWVQLDNPIKVNALLLSFIRG